MIIYRLLFIGIIILTSCHYEKSKLSYYSSYDKGLEYAKKEKKNILLVFDNWGASNSNYTKYIEKAEARELIGNNVVVWLLLDDLNSFGDSMTIGDYNKSIFKKYNLKGNIPVFLIIDYNENILNKEKEYMKYEDFLTYLKSSELNNKQRE